MSFGDIRCVAARKRMSDEISMIINFFLSLSFASDFEECLSTLGNVGAPSDWGFLMAYLLHKNHAQKSPWCQCAKFIDWWLSTKVQNVSSTRVLEQTNMELQLHDHPVCTWLFEHIATNPNFELPTKCQWSTYLMFGVASNLVLEHLHTHLLFEPLLVLPHLTSNVNYSLIPTPLSIYIIT